MNDASENQAFGQQLSSVKIAAIQCQCSANVLKNRKNAEQKIRAAAAAGAQVICLQELFTSLYFCQTQNHDNFALAESLDGPTSVAMTKLAEELQVVLVYSLFERRVKGLFHNTSLVVDTDGAIAGTYRKMHIPDDPSFNEKFYFTPGDLGFDSFETTYGKIGICICWDQWFPEAARLTALSGADVIVYPTAIGWLQEDKKVYGESQVSAWRTMMRSHAIANGVFVVTPNRVGTEDKIEFWGNSFICDPYGQLLAEAGRTEEEVLTADCDFNLIETARTHWPFLRDRRIDSYHDLCHRHLEY